MFKKISFLITLFLLLGLGGVVQAASLPVENYSFEDDNDGNQITVMTWIGDVNAWILRDTTEYGMSSWNFADDEWGHPPLAEYEAADGNVSIFSVTWNDPNDPCEICEIYQILDANVDSNVTIAANRRYTLTFNALSCTDWVNPAAYGALFYSKGEGEANDVILASEKRVLTSPTWGAVGYAGWEEIEVIYVALAGHAGIGKKLGVKLNVPFPWFEGTWVAMDNVRVDWDYLSNAWDPKPADGAENVSRTAVILKWRPGLWAKKTGGHDVYFGTDWANVNSATTANPLGVFKGNQDANSYDPGIMTLGRTYYWRIDEVNQDYNSPPGPVPYPPDGKWKGDIWSFTIEGRARNPYPADGAKDVERNVILRWVAGVESKYHDVYFGTSEAALVSAVTRLNKGTELYDAGSLQNLQIGKRYFWRIDEVNTLIVKGYVWDFKVIDYMLVDDFDFYPNPTELLKVWSEIGGGDIYVNKDVKFAVDGNSMQFEYYNDASPYYSETKRSYSKAQNWSYAGNSVTLLELSYYGDADNKADPPMYVKLSDGTKIAQVNCPDLGGTNPPWRDPNQHIWYIPLKDFKGVTMSKISSIILGVGNKAGESGAGKEQGTIYFDDIKLWPPQCWTEMIGEANFHAVGDFTTAHHGGEDCITDYEDLSILAERDWLMSGGLVGPTAPPTAPIGWYKFDEGSGTTTVNSGSATGGDYNGVFVNTPTWSADSNAGGWSLDLDGGTTDGVLVNDSMNMDGDNSVTFTAWVRRDAAIPKYAGVIVMCRDLTNQGTGFHTDSTATSALGYTWNNWEPSWQWTSGLVMPLNKWAFVALAVEPTQGIMYLGEPNGTSYKLRSATNAWGHDGLLNTPTQNRGGWDGTDRFYIGRDDPNSTDGYTFPGKIDDVRIYNYTLNRANIMYLAGVTGETYIPLDDFRADIDDDDKVDLTDYAILADNWLKQLMWPMP